MVLAFVALIAAACTSSNTLEVTGQTTRSGDDRVTVVDDLGSVPGGDTTGPAPAGPSSGPSGAPVAGPEGSPAAVAAATAVVGDEAPIRIGVLSTLTGGQKFVGEPPYKVALAYAQRLNERGGIDGRRLEVLGYDVCTNCPDEGLAQAKKAVEKDGVFALANTFVVNASLDQVVPYLEEKGIPMIQGASGELSRKPELSPLIFSVGLTVPGRAAIGADFAKRYLQEKGRPPKVALLYFTDALNTLIADEQRKALERVGLEIVDEEPVTYDATMTNQSSQVIKMRAAGAEMVVGAHGVLCAFSMQAADQANWQAPYLCTIMYDPFTVTIAGPSALTDRDVFADTEGYATQDLTGPGVQDYLELMRDYYPDGDIGLVTLYAYLGMRLIEEGVSAQGDSVTRLGLARYIESLEDYDAGGLTAPFSLGPDDHGGIDGAHIVQIHPDGRMERVTQHWTYPAPVHGLPGSHG
jgi:branched-chain amino acid transport system substrate-binding protein